MKLEIKNLCKEFKENIVLNNVNLTMSSGKIYGFVGRNASGKSVLFKIICGFYSPTSGSILLDGYNYFENGEFPKNTRALIEKPKFLPDLTGYDNLELLASIQGKISKNEINDVIEKLNLTEEKDKLYCKYSLGTKQKLGIAQVLMENPDLIILDEPFNGVEKETAEKIRRCLLDEKRKGKLILIASHIKEDISFADEVYEIDSGEISKI